jgi:predicted kinase
MVVLCTGPPCSGKSTLAEGVAGILGAPVLGWDWAMAGLTWCEPIQATLRSLDRTDHRHVGWSVLANLAEAQLRHGRSVVLDGVARAEHVAMIRERAQRHQARSLVVLTSCTDRERLRARVERRRRAIPGWYELTWDHVGSFRWQPPTDVDHTIDTAHDPDPHALARHLLNAVNEPPRPLRGQPAGPT